MLAGPPHPVPLILSPSGLLEYRRFVNEYGAPLSNCSASGASFRLPSPGPERASDPGKMTQKRNSLGSKQMVLFSQAAAELHTQLQYLLLALWLWLWLGDGGWGIWIWDGFSGSVLSDRNTMGIKQAGALS